MALWQYANMANGQIVYIRRVANDDSAPNRIQELLDAQGMSQADLARVANVSVSALNKVIKGTRGLDQDWMRRLAPHLGVTPAELLPVEDNPLSLSVEEKALLARYRAADRSTRAQLSRVSEALTSEAPQSPSKFRAA
ncbi:helix-turn-helix transcriptional regulator [Sphingomonadaceae bacterium jetA1]|uniref:helix-turn-helix domain-containing protein n=1 Tax=Facivitalis istanbulensis TaxID=3075838 RepID=UPI00347A928C